MDELKLRWKNSKTFRILLIAALVYVVLRIGVQAILLADMASPSASAPEGQVASDLHIYVNAAKNFSAREDLYLKGSLERLETHYPYSPAFALLFMPVLLLPLPLLIPLDALFHVAAYALMYIWWARIFKRCGFANASRAMTVLLPLWIVFTGFWDDVAYLNIYIIMALVGTLFIDAVLQEKLGWAIFWLGVIILPIKPHWAFAAMLPLLLGRTRFFFRLVAGTIVVYLLVASATIWTGGLKYGLQQYSDYFGFLARLSRDFPWRGPDKLFLGYNHSILQTIMFYFGVSPLMMKAATLVKMLFLVPLGLVSIRFLTRPLNKRGDEIPRLALDLGFALYLGAFLWLDMVWELSLGIAVFAYLVGTMENKKLINFLWIIFLPYALADIWRLLSYIAFGDAVIYDGSYMLTDPLIYLPWVMIVIIVFYATLVGRLWFSFAKE
ncbi:MAG: hypothetical protein HY867_00805 [Chloroflexi bacterium]|nr:hypothetical protein [Chloroflexota bacterium]